MFCALAACKSSGDRLSTQLKTKNITVTTIIRCEQARMREHFFSAASVLSTLNVQPAGSSLWMTLWLAIPVMVFSFNHSPIISSFALAKREEYGDAAEKKCSRILACSHLMMVV